MNHYIRTLLTFNLLLTLTSLLRADPPTSAGVPSTQNGNNTFTGNNKHAGAESFMAPDITTFGEATTGQGLWFAVTFMNSQQALLTMASRDGKKWGFVDSSGYYNGSGIVRDPSLIRLTGQWWMVNTRSSLSGTVSFTVSRGPTMRELTVITNVDCSSISGISYTWAPQFFMSPGATDYTGVHVFFSAGANDSSMAIYEVHPTNSEMTTWSQPVAIAGTGFPSTIIDPYLLQIGSTYYLWFKNESSHHFGYATSSSLTDGYTTTLAHDGSTDWMNTGFPVEGTVVVPLGPTGVYRVYEDRYVSQGYYYQETTDAFATWSVPLKCQMPYPVSHWDIIRPTDINSLMEILGDFVNDNQVLTQLNGYVGVGGLPTYPFEVISPSAAFPQFGFFTPDNTQLGLDLGRNGSKEFSVTIDESAWRIYNWAEESYQISCPNNSLDIWADAGDFVTKTPGKTLAVQSGANAKAGTFTLTNGGATVGNSSVDANSVVIVTLKSVSGVRNGNPDVVCAPGTGFTVSGGDGDNSTYNYVILEVNP